MANQIDKVLFNGADGTSLPSSGSFVISVDTLSAIASVYTITPDMPSDGGSIDIGYDNENDTITIPGGSTNAQIQAVVDGAAGAGAFIVTGDCTGGNIVFAAGSSNLGFKSSNLFQVGSLAGWTHGASGVAATGDFFTGLDMGLTPTGGGQLLWNSSKSDIETALNEALGETLANTVTLLGADASFGFTNEYGGFLANTLLGTWQFDTTTLFATASTPPQPIQTVQGLAPDAGIQATLSLEIANGPSTSPPDGGTWTFNGVSNNFDANSADGGVHWTSDNAATPSVGSGTLNFTAVDFTAGTAPTVDSSGLTMAGNTVPWDGSFINQNFTPGENPKAGINVVHQLYVQDGTAGQASGGTFNIIGISQSVASAPGDASVAANWSLATGQTFTLSSGAGTVDSVWVLTGPQADVVVPTADYSGLTQAVASAVSTVTPGSPVASGDDSAGSLLIGVSDSIYG